MSNEELVKKLQQCVNEYRKLKKENEKLKQQLIEEKELSNTLDSCVRESARVIETTKESVDNAQSIIKEMKELILFYEQSVSIMFDTLNMRIKNIINNESNRDENIKLLKKEVEQQMAELDKLNKTIM